MSWICERWKYLRDQQWCIIHQMNIWTTYCMIRGQTKKSDHDLSKIYRRDHTVCMTSDILFRTYQLTLFHVQKLYEGQIVSDRRTHEDILKRQSVVLSIERKNDIHWSLSKTLFVTITNHRQRFLSRTLTHRSFSR